MKPLRAISVRQPYAELIVRGIKDVENRGWATSYRGRLLIHAGLRVDRPAMRKYGFGNTALETGKLIGVVDLVDCTSSRGSEWHNSGEQGWYLANPRRFSRPTRLVGNLGLMKISASRARSALASARKPRPDNGEVSLFSFGYWGWGGDVKRLLQLVDALERSRGFEPPIFVDARFSRSVQSNGFREHAFEDVLGFERYRWFRTLGNRSIKMTDRSKIRIVAPWAAEQLLDLALDARLQRRRIIFFCACETPRGCHRQTIGRLLLRAARRRGIVATVAEWPGGPAPTEIATTVGVTAREYDGLLGTRVWVPLPRSMPLAEVASLSFGSVVRLRAHGRDPALAVLGRTGFHNDRWSAEVIWAEEESDDWNATEVVRLGRRERLRAGYAPLR